MLEVILVLSTDTISTYYTYYYDSDWADTVHSETWIITRLSPYEALDSLTDEEKERYNKIFPALILEMKNNLFHPEKLIREEASLYYANFLFKTEDWKSLKMLLIHSDMDIIISALKVLEDYPAARLVQTLEYELKELLKTRLFIKLISFFILTL